MRVFIMHKAWQLGETSSVFDRHGRSPLLFGLRLVLAFFGGGGGGMSTPLASCNHLQYDTNCVLCVVAADMYESIKSIKFHIDR